MQDFNPTCYIDSKKAKPKYITRDIEDFNKYDIYYPARINGFLPDDGLIKEKVNVPEIKFSILDKTFTVPHPLNDIVEEIIDSQDILKLEKNWDLNEADIISESLYLKAAEFLLLYSIYIFKEFNIIIKAPEINPCRNGSIDLSWRTNDARLLINIKFKENLVIASFYGYHKKNNFPKEGIIDIENIDKVMALWMKELK